MSYEVRYVGEHCGAEIIITLSRVRDSKVPAAIIDSRCWICDAPIVLRLLEFGTALDPA